ncbi:MAG: hypothetical protein MUF14_11465 [Hyphomonadaceae bacterium]|nr:hypothetical protein [Hyphomonadaceae bacterium]
MSIVIDSYGRVMAEAGGGETINANAVLDLTGLREMRRNPGMTNLLSRLPLDAFQQAYDDHHLAAPNRTPDGRMIDRAAVLANQRATIERLARDGVIR